MKQVFDWMRKMVVESSFPVGGIPKEERVLMRRKAKEIIDRAEEKWNEDVCELKAVSCDNWRPSCEPNSIYNVQGVAWFRCCPYCGKKIKVVE